MYLQMCHPSWNIIPPPKAVMAKDTTPMKIRLQATKAVPNASTITKCFDRSLLSTGGCGRYMSYMMIMTVDVKVNNWYVRETHCHCGAASISRSVKDI